MNSNCGVSNWNMWCHKILPLTYDDSLSYYEVLCRLTYKINEILEAMQRLEENLPTVIAEMVDSAIAK